MKINRRDFLKIVGVGVTVAVMPGIGAASKHIIKMSQLDILENSIIFKLHNGVSAADPFGQRAALEWKGRGLDGKLYRDYCEMDVDSFDQFENFGEEIYSLLVEQIGETSQLSHLKIPSWNNILNEIVKAKAKL